MLTEIDGFAWQGGILDRRRVTRCALARLCGVCGETLGRPIVFVGDAEEEARNTFHLPPLHEACARSLLASVDEGAVLVRTGGFEFVRPGRDDPDPMPRFEPNSRV
ncbi:MULTISPECIES: hypothetical protein [unclassified Nocardioides]|uniref:hypothetical protein n=1 Tax=unclassified Nocardioides TaxID=2615069 RepID=UPI0006F9110C|nr:MULTISPECIES: hypothetical protein [unclassified Nocardioides]KRA32541.1 hypothetical protein ASD81_13425 [Nocardioides sp. Root614]KRA89194.1 hypothetical protein ASD84_13690 [Nocardioides sp. Root682]